MPHTNYVLGVAALSPDQADARCLPAWGWATPPAEVSRAAAWPVASMRAPGVPWGANPMMASPDVMMASPDAGPPASGAVTTYFLWDGEDILVETDGSNSGWTN